MVADVSMVTNVVKLSIVFMDERVEKVAKAVKLAKVSKAAKVAKVAKVPRFINVANVDKVIVKVNLAAIFFTNIPGFLRF